MTSVIARHYNYNEGKALIRLNRLQSLMKRQVEQKIQQGRYCLEEQPCPCGSIRQEVIAERDRFGFRVTNVICLDCGLIRLNPRFTQETYQEFYNFEYRKLYTGRDNDDNIEKIFQAQYTTGKRIEEFIAQVTARQDGAAFLRNPIRVLEIGCSSGGILAYFRDQGHEIVGLDFDERYLAFGRERYGLNLQVGKVESLLGEKPFDVVIMSHTFEHLSHPFQVLEQMKKILPPSGVVFICVPGLRREAYYQNPPFDFLYYLQNAHVFTYSLRTLRNVFRQARFDLLSGTEEVFALFRPAQEVKAGDHLWQNDYADCLSYLKAVEQKRVGRQVRHRLSWPVNSFSRKINKVIRRG